MNATKTATSGTEVPRPQFQVPGSTSQAPSSGTGTGFELAGAEPQREDRIATGTTSPAPTFSLRVRQLLAGLTALGIAARLGFRWWHHARSWVKTDNAYIAAHIHTVSARV